jgi:hypothetical protein
MADDDVAPAGEAPGERTPRERGLRIGHAWMWHRAHEVEHLLSDEITRSLEEQIPTDEPRERLHARIDSDAYAVFWNWFIDGAEASAGGSKNN